MGALEITLGITLRLAGDQHGDGPAVAAGQVEFPIDAVLRFEIFAGSTQAVPALLGPEVHEALAQHLLGCLETKQLGQARKDFGRARPFSSTSATPTMF